MLLIKKLFPLLWPTLRRSLSRLAGEHPETAYTPAHRLRTAWWARRHAAKVQEARGGPFAMALVGDSITHFWETTGQAAWRESLGDRPVLNLGFDGDLTEHVLWRIQNGEWPDHAPGLTVLLAGTNNNIRHESPAATVAGLRAILRALRQATPESDIVLLALFPRNRPQSWTRLRNHQVNALLPELAREEKVRLLDLSHLWLTEGGQLDRSAMPDQLHPGPLGYARWAAVLRSLANATADARGCG